MGKKNPPADFGLTEQLLMLHELEERTERQRLDAIVAKAAKKIDRAIEKTSAHLEQENSTEGLELINLLDRTAAVSVAPLPMDSQALLMHSAEPVAAIVNVCYALIPEHHALAVPISQLSQLSNGDPETWAVVTADELFENIDDDEIDSGIFEDVRVAQLLKWMYELRHA